MEYNYYSNLIKNSCINLGWHKLVAKDMAKIINLPYGIYAYTKPLDMKPNDEIWAHEYVDTIYIGVAGKSNDIADFYHDKKSKNHYRDTGPVYMRLNAHKKALTRTNIDKKRDTCYQVFYENYGYGYDIIDKIYYNVIIPKNKLNAYEIRSWLLLKESESIYINTCIFQRPPLLQIAHKSDIGDNSRVDDSHSQKRTKELKAMNLENFL